MTIDVYTSLVPRRDEPLEGSTSFFHEKVIEWRELNAAHDWLECYKEIQPLCSTLPLLVHHQDDIVHALLGRMTMDCKLSLEPILHLIGTLSRDLASDFLRHLEKVFVTMIDLVVVQGGDGDAKVLEHVYTAMSAICKNLAKYLVLDVKPLLKLTVPLRHHASHHIKKFTADALGFLIRRAKDEQAEDAVQYLLAEAIEENQACRGNGEMIASSMKGVGNGLHSRCDRIMNMLFDDGMVSSDGRIARGAVYAVRQACMFSCFEHVRESERLVPIWNRLIRYCCEEMSTSSLEEKARIMRLLSILVRHRGGSRVVDHIDAMFSLVDQCMVPHAGGTDEISQECHESSMEKSVSEYICPDFEESVLNFVATFLRIVAKHQRQGLDLEHHVASWRGMLEHVDVDTYLKFVTSLFYLPHVAIPFIPLAIDRVVEVSRQDECIWRCVVALGDFLSGGGSPPDIDMEKLQPFIEQGIRTRDTSILWAAARTIRLLPWSRRQETLYEDILEVANDNLALISSVYISKAQAMSHAVQQGPVEGIDAFSDTVLEALRNHPKNYYCVKAASVLMTSVPCHQSFSDGMNMLDFTSPCRHMRVHSLIIASQGLPAENPLAHILDLETHPLGADSGRHAVVTLGRVQNMIEYKKVSADLVEPTVKGLLGLLYVKLSSYWSPAAKALAAAVNAFPDVAWPIILETLHQTQREMYKHGMNTVSVEPVESNSFEAYVQEARPDAYSDAAARLSHQLKCLADVNASILLKKSKEWVPLFLTFSNDERQHDAEDDAIDEEQQQEDTPRRHVPPRVWRSLLRDWFKVLLSFSSLNQISDSRSVLESVSSHVMDLDPLVQKTVFNVLKLFKLKWLNPYVERILRLVDNKTLRSELTAFPLAHDATSTRSEDSVVQIEAEHRKDLVPFIIACLFPRMRKRNGRLGGKGMYIHSCNTLTFETLCQHYYVCAGAPGSARVAILNFLSGAEPSELSALLELFLLPLSPCFIRLDETESPKKKLYLSCCDEDLWWAVKLDTMQGEYWMEHIDVQSLANQPMKRHLGYLNAIDDLLKHLGFRLVSYMPVMCTLIVKMLYLTDSKEVRIKCLRLLAVILQTFPNQVEYGFMWDVFFDTVEKFIPNIPTESNAPRPPALLDICKALSEDTSLCTVLLRQRSLLENSFGVLSVPHCSDTSRSTALDVMENMFDHHDDNEWLLPHIDTILTGLDYVLKDFRKHRLSSIRALQILERIAADTDSMDTALKLSSALLNLLIIPKRKWQTDTRRKIDEELTSRGCAAIGALWKHMSSYDTVQLRDCSVTQLAPLVLVLKTQEARESLSNALESLSLLQPNIQTCARLFSGMNAYVMNEYDYDKRLDSYASLTPDCWKELLSNDCSSVIIYQCCIDLSNQSDISLRHSSARALENLLIASSGNEGSIAVLKRVLMPEIRLKLVSPSLTVRQEHLECIRKISLALPESFPELQAVTHKDEDLDFWMNVCHVQLHRRARAFSRLQNTTINSVLLRGYILVLIERTIVEGVDAKNEAKHETKQSDVDKSANVTDAAITLLSNLARDMEWKDLQHVMTRYLDLVKIHVDDPCIKAVIRASSLILDAVSSTQAGNEAFTELVTTRVIPDLKEKMVEKEVVRTPVAMALVKVLKMLPQSYVRNELPRILQIVCNLLRVRLQRIRDDARNVLAAMTKELGPMYFVFIIQVLKTSLPLRGFTAHVLGYTFHDVLKSVAPEAKQQIGCLDCCINQIVPIIEGDLFSDIADAKEAAEFASSYKESKRCKANDSFLLLCSLIKLEDSLPKLLDIVWEKIPMASHSPKVRTKLSLLLQYASRGIIDNPSITFENMSDMLYGVTEITKANSTNHAYIMTEFAMTTYYNCLKKKCFDLNSMDTARTDMVISSVFDVLTNSKSSGAICSALQLLYYIFERRSDAIQNLDITKTIINLLKRCSSTMHPIAQESFSVLAKLVEHRETRPQHMKFLLTWAFSELGSSSEKQGAFTLLKAIVRKKIVLPEVYDVMNSVQELMIKSQHSTIRQLSSTIILSFLLDYPLGNKRLEQHLQFFLSNMAYEHESGREASILLMEAIVRKFPQHVLNTWADKFFIFFITRIVNEGSRKLREKIVGMVLLLLARVSPETQKRFLISYCLEKWMDSSTVTTSAVLVIFVKLLEKKATTLDGNLLEEFFRGSIPKVLQHMEQSSSDPIFIHKSILFLEACYTYNPDMVGAILTETGFFSNQSSLILHSHTWVRKAMARLIGLALQQGHIDDEYTDSFVQQLEELISDDAEADALGAQAVKNLVFVLPQLGDATLLEVAQRMVKLADSTSYVKRIQRNYALRFIAASVARLGSDKSKDILPLLLRPIFRIQDNDNHEDNELAQDIFNHIKKIVGADTALAAYNKAREQVTSIRLARRVDKKLVEVNEPQKAAAIKIKKNLRKKIGRKKKLDHVRRLRDAGHIVKNKR